ncbi:alpha/beta hydrolase [Lacihabitans sp. LS3-19]|uniref:alpha/beta fold hydrolase n=1 Tax=Lacihabitans sp. LS3-19 TaxID=2487335 RepID=UPI0020CF2635|nr:alpha/beta hydrolase [Lacihabitans sp. LS3-19]MCP9768550.1 alpha/beta hydrolase [Lacihabitans sp. LS3-19]
MKFLKILFITLFVGLLALIITFWKNDLSVDYLKSKYANEESEFMPINGIQVHFRDQGLASDSLPLVLIHGTAASLHTWEPWVSELKETKRIITFDLPAYGLTGPNANHDYSQKAYVEMLDSLLIKLKKNRCILGGNSLGGSVSWNYAIEHPEKIEKLILVDAGGYPLKSTSVPLAFKLAKIPILSNLLEYITPRAMVESSVKNVYFDPSKVSNELIDRYYELTLREGNREAFKERLASTKNTASKNNTSELIKTIKVPTLILWGDGDQLIPVESAYKFHDDLPNDTLVILKNLGHVPMEEDPKASVKAVKEFINKVY